MAQKAPKKGVRCEAPVQGSGEASGSTPDASERRGRVYGKSLALSQLTPHQFTHMHEGVLYDP
jgi:hypothetical protein